MTFSSWMAPGAPAAVGAAGAGRALEPVVGAGLAVGAALEALAGVGAAGRAVADDVVSPPAEPLQAANSSVASKPQSAKCLRCMGRIFLAL